MKSSQRSVVRSVHGVAGGCALLLALTFLFISVSVELFGSHDAVAGVKRGILLAVPLLAICAIVAGGSGSLLSKKSKAKVISDKARRMRVIGANALLVLIPCSVFLDRMASAGEFGTRFAVVQAIEFTFGAINVTLLGLNMRAGLQMRARRSRAKRPRPTRLQISGRAGQ